MSVNHCPILQLKANQFAVNGFCFLCKYTGDCKNIAEHEVFTENFQNTHSEATTKLLTFHTLKWRSAGTLPKKAMRRNDKRKWQHSCIWMCLTWINVCAIWSSRGLLTRFCATNLQHLWTYLCLKSFLLTFLHVLGVVSWRVQQHRKLRRWIHFPRHEGGKEGRKRRYKVKRNEHHH